RRDRAAASGPIPAPAARADGSAAAGAGGRGPSRAPRSKEIAAQIHGASPRPRGGGRFTFIGLVLQPAPSGCQNRCGLKELGPFEPLGAPRRTPVTIALAHGGAAMARRRLLPLSRLILAAPAALAGLLVIFVSIA